jgi:hypothetical protein
MGRIEQLKQTLPLIKQVRFKEVIFSFHVYDMESLGIGQELVDLIHLFKKQLEPCLKNLQLPRLVRVILWNENPLARESSGTFGGFLPLLSQPFHLCINTDNLHEEEISFDDERKFQIRLLQVFIHELVHFTTTDEREANKISWEILHKVLSEKKEGI